MRRSFMLSTVLAASVAVLGACTETKTNVPEKPAVTPAPVAPASPIGPASPINPASPVTSPVKPGTTPVVKKADEKTIGKDAKPAVAETPKAK